MSVVMNRANFASEVIVSPGRFKSQISSPLPPPLMEPQHSEKTKTLKNCCRIFVELMFTQVK